MDRLPTLAEPAPLKETLAAIVGDAHVHDDAQTRAFFSHDIFRRGEHTAALIAAPGSVDELCALMAAAHRAGWSVAPRGGGMSYTNGYLPADARTLALDTRRLDRIVEIDAANMTVTVQAGCTWAALHEALAPQRLRTPFWGALSGLKSTIGGGLSQLNAMFGAGQHGTSSESVVGLAVVLADGTLLRTGARAPGSAGAFYRHYGPDLAGLFCGDCGTLGIKAEITLRLMRTPPHEAYASFAFASGAALLRALAEIARAGVCSESCGFDPGLTRVRMQRASLGSDLKTLGAVVAKQKSLMRGLVEAGRIALAGRDFIEEDSYPLHLVCEGRSEAAVAADIEAVRRIARGAGGAEIENTVAKVLRAQPFPPLNSALGPGGQRWLPVHGVAPLAQAEHVFEAVQAVFAERAPAFERHGVQTAYLFTHLSTNAVIVEPVFYWPGAAEPIHASALEPEHFAKLPVLPDDPAATAVVNEARERLLEVFQRFGCAHFQIGRTYPYRASRDAASWRLLEAAKAALDPRAQLNPGVLGLGGA